MRFENMCKSMKHDVNYYFVTSDGDSFRYSMFHEKYKYTCKGCSKVYFVPEEDLLDKEIKYIRRAK